MPAGRLVMISMKFVTNCIQTVTMAQWVGQQGSEVVVADSSLCRANCF